MQFTNFRSWKQKIFRTQTKTAVKARSKITPAKKRCPHEILLECIKELLKRRFDKLAGLFFSVIFIEFELKIVV